MHTSHRVISVVILAIAFLMPSTSFAATANVNHTGILTLEAQVKALRAELAALLASRMSVAAGRPTVTVVTRPAASEDWRYRYAQQKRSLGSEVRKRSAADVETATSTYKVQNGELRGSPTANERLIFELFLGIAGEDFTARYLKSYAIFRDARNTTLASMSLRGDEEPAWRLSVNAAGAAPSNEKWTRDMAAILVHEFAHVVTLNGDEIVYVDKNDTKNKEEDDCATFETIVGCARSDSYVADFAEAFWNETDIKEAKEGSAYRRNENGYVTVYAAKSLEEDMAESFAEFVFNAKPTGETKEKDRKVRFFYEYPELVALRTAIRAYVEPYFKK